MINTQKEEFLKMIWGKISLKVTLIAIFFLRIMLISEIIRN